MRTCAVSPGGRISAIPSALCSLSASTQARLANLHDRMQAATDRAGLKAVLLEQTEADALFLGEVLLTTFYTLLTTLIGPSLTARLLRDVWEPSLSDTPSQENSP